MSKTGQFGTEFEAQASERGLLGEFWEFLLHNKKYWMIPIVATLLMVGVLVFLSSTAVTHFIYSLF